MGNAETAYKQVSVNDDSVSEDLMFVFHNTEGDCNERVIHDVVDYNKASPLTYTIVMDERLIAEERMNEKTYTTLSCTKFKPGDAIEVLATPSFWALYAGDEFCIYLRNEEIVHENIKVVFSDYQLRKVNQVYKLKVLPATQIIEKAKSQIGQKCMWRSSECFVMWCRTGMTEFEKESFSPRKCVSKTCVLEFLHEDGTSTRHDFKTLRSLIEFKNDKKTLDP